jgi:hypothetical protein
MDVIGVMLGTLKLSEPARVLDISASGALLESPQPVTLASTQAVRFTLGGHEISVDATVRHVRPVEADGNGPPYLIGLEFVSPSHPLLRSIEDLAVRPDDSLG